MKMKHDFDSVKLLKISK